MFLDVEIWIPSMGGEGRVGTAIPPLALYRDRAPCWFLVPPEGSARSLQSWHYPCPPHPPSCTIHSSPFFSGPAAPPGPDAQDGVAAAPGEDVCAHLGHVHFREGGEWAAGPSDWPAMRGGDSRLGFDPTLVGHYCWGALGSHSPSKLQIS